MTKREVAFSLIGLAVGLLFAEVAIIEVLRSLYQRAFIVAYGWDRVLLAIPVLPLVGGIALILYKPKSERPPG